MITVWERGRKESGEEMRFKLGLGFAVLSEGKRCETAGLGIGRCVILLKRLVEAGTRGHKGLYVEILFTLCTIM